MSACSCTERCEASTVSPLEVRLCRSCFTSVCFVNVEVVHLLEKIRKLDRAPGDEGKRDFCFEAAIPTHFSLSAAATALAKKRHGSLRLC
ncbi:hypothetical protein BHM03_00015834 [Ensete ventricosum]|nr:hypothetical protein BHM03_00015834 [Ensete ventricosum]